MSVSTTEYAVIPGFRPLLLDLHHPGTANAPLVLYLHGGGWRQGSRTVFGPAYRDWTPSPFARLVEAGLAVASVDYRLSGEATFPAQLDDVTAALTWVREHVDSDRIAVWGESAGGHLAALLGLTAPGLCAVVDWYGPTDLPSMPSDAAATGISVTDPGAPDSREALLLGGSVDQAPAAASPVNHVHAGAPPFLILHGTADRFVPCAQSRRLADALDAHGVPVDLRLLDGADHMWLGSEKTAEAAFTASLEFVLTHL